MPAETVVSPEHSIDRRAQRLRLVGRGASRVVTAVADRPRLVLPGLIVAHWLLLLAFALTVRHNGWIYYQGGDQIWYSTTGWLLGHGELPPTRIGYGWSILIAPIMLAFGPGYVDAMPAVILLNVLVLAPIALLAVYGIANRLAGRAFALWAALLWVAAPFLVIPLWRQDYHERFVEQVLPQALGLGGLADYPSMVLLLCSAYFIVRAVQEPGWQAPVLAGLLAGLAIGTKPANALFLVGAFLAFAVAKAARPLLAFGLALAPSVLTLAVWKQRGLGDLPLFAFEEVRIAAGSSLAAIDAGKYLEIDWDVLLRNGAELREYFWSARLLEWVPIAGVIAVSRRSLPVAALLGGWFGAYLLVKGASPLATIATGSFFRMLMPAYPAYFLLAVALPFLIPTVATRLAARWPAVPEPRFGSRTVVAAAILVVVPLAVALLARPERDAANALTLNGILVPVDGDFDVRIAADGPAREVTWDDPDGRADVFYRVYRTGADGVDTTCQGSGAPQCELEMILLGTTREPRWRDGSPPPGSVYRIGRAANWLDDPEGGDVFLISRPTRAP
jgi:hypothetical protein